MAGSNSKYPVSRLAPPFSLVEMAKEIEQADRLINARASAKLQLIADQIRALQDEARKTLAEARKDQELHRAHSSFIRKPGHIYHLYKKDDGGFYFSMLSPSEWRKSPPHRFVGSYRLENDGGWQRIDVDQSPG